MSRFFTGNIEKKGMKSQGEFSLSKRNAVSVCIYNCFEWDCLQTDIILLSSVFF